MVADTPELAVLHTAWLKAVIIIFPSPLARMAWVVG